MDKTKYSQLKEGAIKLRKKGLSYREIGKELGSKRQSVHEIERNALKKLKKHIRLNKPN